MENRVLELAAALGRVEESERERLRPLCRAAVLEWSGRLREGLRPEDCGSAFPMASAWWALALLDARENVKRFSAGDLTVETGTEYGRGGTLRRSAEALMRPYVRDECFAFRGVQG